MIKKKKSPEAMSLGRKGGLARKRNLTAEQRKAAALHAANVRYGKTKPANPEPARWYGLILIPEDPAAPLPGHIGDLATSRKRLDQAHAHPEVILWSKNRSEVVERSKQKDLSDAWTEIIDVDYDPRRFSIQREFQPDVSRQLQALKGLVDPEGDRS